MPGQVDVQVRLVRRLVGTLVADEGEVLGVSPDPVHPQPVAMAKLFPAEIAGEHVRLRQLALLEEPPPFVLS